MYRKGTACEGRHTTDCETHLQDLLMASCVGDGLHPRSYPFQHKGVEQLSIRNCIEFRCQKLLAQTAEVPILGRCPS